VNVSGYGETPGTVFPVQAQSWYL